MVMAILRINGYLTESRSALLTCLTRREILGEENNKYNYLQCTRQDSISTSSMRPLSLHLGRQLSLHIIDSFPNSRRQPLKAPRTTHTSLL